MFFNEKIKKPTFNLHVYLQVLVSNDKLRLLVAYGVSYAARLDTSVLASVRVLLGVDERIERTAQNGAVIVAHVDLEIARRSWYERGHVVSRIPHVHPLTKRI